MSENEPLRLIKIGLKEYSRILDVHGRSNRTQFWTFAIINIGLAQAFMASFMMIGFNLAEHSPATPPADVFFWVKVGMWAMIAMLVPYVPVLIRRLHDSNRSGFWALPHLLFLLGGTAGFTFLFGNRDYPDGLFSLLLINNVCHLAYCLVVLYFAIQTGTEGPNRFGPQPVTD